MRSGGTVVVIVCIAFTLGAGCLSSQHPGAASREPWERELVATIHDVQVDDHELRLAITVQVEDCERRSSDEDLVVRAGVLANVREPSYERSDAFRGQPVHHINDLHQLEEDRIYLLRVEQNLTGRAEGEIRSNEILARIDRVDGAAGEADFTWVRANEPFSQTVSTSPDAPLVFTGATTATTLNDLAGDRLWKVYLNETEQGPTLNWIHPWSLDDEGGACNDQHGDDLDAGPGQIDEPIRGGRLQNDTLAFHNRQDGPLEVRVSDLRLLDVDVLRPDERICANEDATEQRMVCFLEPVIDRMPDAVIDGCLVQGPNQTIVVERASTVNVPISIQCDEGVGNLPSEATMVWALVEFRDEFGYVHARHLDPDQRLAWYDNGMAMAKGFGANAYPGRVVEPAASPPNSTDD